MAVDRVLTSDEKLSLQNDFRFQNLVRQSTLDNSLMWTQDDGSTYVTEDTRIIWGKSRLRGQSVVINPNQQNGNTLAPQFTLFLAAINLWDSAIAPWVPGVYSIGQKRTYNGNIWERLTAGSDTYLTPPVEGLNWTLVGVVNTTIMDYMEANSIFVTLSADWMSEQIRSIDMGGN